MPKCNFANSEEILKSQIPSDLELELIDLVIDHRILLGGMSLSFADIVDKLVLKFSPIEKTRPEQVDASVLRVELQKLQAEYLALGNTIEALREKIQQMMGEVNAVGGNPYRSAEVDFYSRQLQSLYTRQNGLSDLIRSIEVSLKSGSSNIDVFPKVLGEFVHSVDPYVVLYYNNISDGSIHDRYKKLIGVLVHEMFHAWYYFMAQGHGRSVLAIDEPMVEFSALFFLENLAKETVKSHPKLSFYIAEVLRERIWLVQNKQYSTGNTAAYGYGYYLYENLGKNRHLWIYEYSKRSSDISPSDPDVQDFQRFLIPCYPFNDERKPLTVLEKIIFGARISRTKYGTRRSVTKTSNPTGGVRRTMSLYPKTKSDPICKWRVASVDTVIELVSLLPKTRMPKAAFRGYMSHAYDGAYFRTPYQMALQLGLYYEDEVEYIPRFDHNITIVEATAYMHKWMERYYVPNPFTKRGFINVVPSINLLNGLVDYLLKHPNKPNLATAGVELFGGEMGNIGCVKYVLNNYSNLIEVDGEYNMNLLLHRSGPIQVYNNRDDKKAFFDHFN